jgi:hypothetical protein
VTPESVVERAFRCINRGCHYGLGKGGMHPEAEHPWVIVEGVQLCDCSGFAMWCLGLSRFQDPVWFDTTKIVTDAVGSKTLFERIPIPMARPSDLIVYGDHGGSQGHVGVITQCGTAGPVTVTHCSGGNMRKLGDAVAAGGAELWLARDGIIARCLKVV